MFKRDTTLESTKKKIRYVQALNKNWVEDYMGERSHNWWIQLPSNAFEFEKFNARPDYALAQSLFAYPRAQIGGSLHMQVALH